MSEFYPKLGEKLFISGNHKTKAIIPASIDGSTSELLDRYYRGFKELADEGVQHVVENFYSHEVKDKLIFPIMFNYRHYLELILKKYAIKYAKDKGELEKLGENLGHSLEFYWKRVKPLLTETYKHLADIEEVVAAAESYILQFQEVDNGSFTFRYPFAKGEKFAPYFEKDMHIDVVHLKGRMDELYNLLEYLDDSINYDRQNEERY